MRLSTAQIKHRIPALHWLRHYDRRLLRGDLAAGVTVAMMLIPQAMSYAMLAGLPPQMGLYASVLPLLVYALLGSSRHLAVGPVAMAALLLASGVGALTEPGSADYIALAIVLTLMVGLIQFAMGLLRLGFLTNFMSHPMISGFTSAAALIIGFSQLRHLLGLDLPRSENIPVLVWHAVQQWSAINPATVAIGVSGALVILLLRRLNPLWPGALIALVAASLAVWLLQLDSRMAVSVVGAVPAGLPAFAWPELTWARFSQLLPIAGTIALIGFIESIAVAKKIAAQKRYEVDPNQELTALGLANMAGAVCKAMPVTGGFSRSAVNTSAGANTGLASIVTALLIGLALLLFTPWFYHIPHAILASIIMVAVVGLIDLREVRHLWVVKKDDLAMLVFTFAATLVFGVKTGIFLAIGASMVWFVMKTTRPNVAVLGRLPGSEIYRNIQRHPEAETEPGILAIRFDAQFYYGNVSFLKETVRRVEREMSAPLKAVVLDASAINQIDSSADTALHELLRDYRSRGVDLFLARTKGPVRDVLERSGFVDALGADHFFDTTHQAVTAAKFAANRGETS